MVYFTILYKVTILYKLNRFLFLTTCTSPSNWIINRYSWKLIKFTGLEDGEIVQSLQFYRLYTFAHIFHEGYHFLIQQDLLVLGG